MERRCKKILMWLGFLALLLGVGTAWGQTPYPYSQPPRVKVKVRFYGNSNEYPSTGDCSTARQAVQEVLGSHSGKSVKDIEVLTIDNDNIKAPKGSELPIEDWSYLANMKATLRELYVEPGVHFKDPMPKDQFRGAFRLEVLELCGVK